MNNSNIGWSKFFDNERCLRTYCLLHNISYIYVHFDGSGDSGCIDNIEVRSGNTVLNTRDCPKITVYTLTMPQFHPDTKQWLPRTVVEELREFEDFLMDHVYQSLDYTGVNWYDNDGGYGTWHWTVENGLEFDVQQRIMQIETAHYEIRELGEPEDHAEEEV